VKQSSNNVTFTPAKILYKEINSKVSGQKDLDPDSSEDGDDQQEIQD
jgi:hypothetical protein